MSIGGVYYVKGDPHSHPQKTESIQMSSDFIAVSQARDKLLETLKEIRKAVASVNLFSSEAEQHKQMDRALREISEILEGAGVH